MAKFGYMKRSKGKKTTKKLMSKDNQIKIVTEAPKKAVIDMEKQITFLYKKEMALAKSLKPEVKYLDTTYSGFQVGQNGVSQNTITYPASGVGEGQRLGEQISNVKLHMKGQFKTCTSTVFSGNVHIYILCYKPGVNIYNYVDATASTTAFINPDISGYYSALSLRNWEHRQDWRVIKHVKMHFPAPTYTPYSATYTMGNTANVNFTCKLPNPKFNTGLLSTSIDYNLCQILVLADNGSSGSFATGSGYIGSLIGRLTYTDS